MSIENTQKDRGLRVFWEPEISAALEFAKLEREALKRAPHPDSGTLQICLEADIREYSAFIAGLAVRRRSADAMVDVVDNVQMEHLASGDTRFWFSGIEVV